MQIPWVENPFRLVSWWEMEKFSAEQYVTICANLAATAAAQAKQNSLLLPPEHKQALADSLKEVEKLCRDIGLKTAALQILSMANRLERGFWKADSHQVSTVFFCLNDAIRAEMSTQLFLRVFPERVDYYDQQEIFGPDVNTNFQSAKRDIKEAGSCYACDRGTAAVMHLMRVLEVGLNALATELKVSFERRNWENVINDIESEIDKINGPSWGPDWKTKLQFYSGAAKDFRYFKDAWRNHAMHYREHYDATEAFSIFGHVKTFMQHLAEGGLKE